MSRYASDPDGYGQGNPYDSMRAPPPVYSPYQTAGAAMDVEMQPYHSEAPARSLSQAVLDELSEIEADIKALDDQLSRLQSRQRRALSAPGVDKALTQDIENLNDAIATAFRSSLERMKDIKRRPESISPTNKAQVGRLERRLKQFQDNYRATGREYSRGIRDQVARQFRIVRPDATANEVAVAADDAGSHGSVFAQALMNSDRSGSAQRTLSAVRERHNSIQRIEQQLVELAQLFNEVEAMVTEQDVKVLHVEKGTNETTHHLEQANVQLQTATKHAWNTRRNKWRCFWLCVVLMLIIVIIVVIKIEIDKGSSSSSTTTTTTNSGN